MKIIYLLPLLLLIACKQSTSIELKFETVEEVNLSALPARWPSAQNINGVKQDEIGLLRVKFSSPIDIVENAKAKTLHLSIEASHCNGGAGGERIFVLPYLSANDHSGVPGSNAEQTSAANSKGKNGRFVYDLLIPLAGNELQRLFKGVSTPDRIPYLDASKLSDDVCIQMIAAGMWAGPSIRSNVMIVPNASIKSLIDKR